MLSGKLIQLIESHPREITERVLREIWRDPDLMHLHRLPEAELRERGQLLLENFGLWLTGRNEEEFIKEQEAIGKLRFEQGVPLHEAIRALCIIKYNIIDFLEEQGIPKDPLGLYAEEELEHRIGRFFDILIFHMVRGYEVAWHRAVRAAA